MEDEEYMKIIVHYPYGPQTNPPFPYYNKQQTESSLFEVLEEEEGEDDDDVPETAPYINPETPLPFIVNYNFLDKTKESVQKLIEENTKLRRVLEILRMKNRKKRLLLHNSLYRNNPHLVEQSNHRLLLQRINVNANPLVDVLADRLEVFNKLLSREVIPDSLFHKAKLLRDMGYSLPLCT